MTDLITSLRALAAARHDDLSIAVDAVIEIERQRAEIERLHRAHDVACEGGERLHAKYNQLRFEIERLLQAFGLLTTTVPDMEIDIENAVGMAQRVVAEVDRQRAEIERLHKAHQTACEGGDLLRAEIERLREALQESACACSSIRECASEWAKDGKCPHLIARVALEGKP